MIKKATELVFFGACGYHYVLLDVNSPAFQYGPPKAPHQTECSACGEHFPVILKEIHLGKGKAVAGCTLYTAIKRKNPLCLLNPLFLFVSW